MFQYYHTLIYIAAETFGITSPDDMAPKKYTDAQFKSLLANENFDALFSQYEHGAPLELKWGAEIAAHALELQKK